MQLVSSLSVRSRITCALMTCRELSAAFDTDGARIMRESGTPRRQLAKDTVVLKAGKEALDEVRGVGHGSRREARPQRSRATVVGECIKALLCVQGTPGCRPPLHDE